MEVLTTVDAARIEALLARDAGTRTLTVRPEELA